MTPVHPTWIPAWSTFPLQCCRSFSYSARLLFLYRMNTNNQEASACEDFDGITNHNLSFLVRETEKTISIRITNDKLVENNETFQFSLSGSEGSTVFPECKAANVIIISNDGKYCCN